MPIGSNPSNVPVPITASTLIKTGAGVIAGYLIVSATTATIKIYDNTAASGTVIQPVTGSLTVTTPTHITLNAAFANGLYVEIAGTASIVILYAPA